MNYNDFIQYLVYNNAPQNIQSWVNTNEYSFSQFWQNAQNIRTLGWIIYKANLSEYYINELFDYARTQFNSLQDNAAYSIIQNAYTAWDNEDIESAVIIAQNTAHILEPGDPMILVCICIALKAEFLNIKYVNYKDNLNYGVKSCIVKTPQVITTSLVRSLITEQQILDNIA